MKQDIFHKPKVSVVIACYNYAHYLPDTVRCITDQTFQDFEIIIVNDGSEDNSLEVARRLAAKYHEHAIRIIDQHNQGASAARNAGVRAALGEYVMSLDADDLVLPTYLQKTVGLLEENSGISIAYTNFTAIGDFPEDQKEIVRGEDFDLNRLMETNYFPSCALFRKKDWDKTGGYKKLIGAEDWELWLNMCSKVGCKAGLIREVLYLYRKHGPSKNDITRRYKDLVMLEIKLSHPDLYFPKLYRTSPAIAKIWPVITEVRFSYYLYRNYPGVHAFLRGVRDGFNNLVGRFCPGSEKI